MITVFTQVPVLTESEVNPNAGIRVLSKQDLALNNLSNVLTNLEMSRSAFIKQFTDPRRNINYECGYPDSTSYAGEQYQELFDRFHIANRVVSLMPTEAWQVQPKVFEDESASNVTEFEAAWDELGKQLKADSYYQDEEGSLVWNYLKRLNIVSGIGTFGVMLLGIDDGKHLDQPVDGVEQDYPTSTTSYDIYGPSPTETMGGEQPMSTLGTDAQYQPITMSPPVEGSPKGKRKLLFLRVFSEKLVQITQYESNVNSPRFGQPKMYRVTLNDSKTQSTGIGLPTTTVAVHWTRLIHVADNLVNSDVFGNPRMLPVLNQLLDLRKVYGAASEGYWKQAFAVLVAESLPQLGGDPSLDMSAVKNAIENIDNSLQRSAVVNGFSLKTLPPQVTDPTPYITAGLEAICIQLGVPVRVFKGSERGELASSQDDASWNDRVRAYQRDYITPHVITKFIDRLIAIGILPEPTGYSIEWADLDSLTDQDKAGIALTQTQTIGTYISQGVENVIDPMNFLTKVMGMDEETAQAILDDAVKHQEEMMQQAQDLADENGFQPAPPPGFSAPEPGPFEEEQETEEQFFPTGNYDQDQERDADGKWSSGGSGGDGGNTESASVPKSTGYSVQKSEGTGVQSGAGKPHEIHTITHDGNSIGTVSSYTDYKDTKQAGNKFATGRKEVTRWMASVKEGYHKVYDLYKRGPDGKPVVRKGDATQLGFSTKSEALEFVKKTHKESKPKPTDNADNCWKWLETLPTNFVDNEEIIDLVPADNMFCATGEGGGVDPSLRNTWRTSGVI